MDRWPGLGVIDTVLHGHSPHATTCPEACVVMFELVQPFDPPTTMARATHERFDDDWDEYRGRSRIVEVVESCRLV